jgi:hypothetical protein
MANEKGSPQQRKKRIAELEAEIDGLQREALALGAEPTADFLPWVILGAKARVGQSIFNPSASTTGVQKTTSASRRRRNFSGVVSGLASKPESMSFCW